MFLVAMKQGVHRKHKKHIKGIRMNKVGEKVTVFKPPVRDPVYNKVVDAPYSYA